MKYISQENIADGDTCVHSVISTRSWILLSQGDYPPIQLSGCFQIWHLRCSSCFSDGCLEIRIFTEPFLMQVKGYKSSVCLSGEENKTDVPHLSANTICLQLSFPTSLLFLTICLVSRNRNSYSGQMRHLDEVPEHFSVKLNQKEQLMESYLNQCNDVFPQCF